MRCSKYSLYSLDVWKDIDGGWDINNWYMIASLYIPDSYDDEDILKLLIKEHFLTSSARSKCYCESTSDSSFTIYAKKTHKPMYTLGMAEEYAY